ncbi:MAG: TetR/AcrR family transcriptional regulator [Propionibacteriaceae bacterium]
MPEQPALVKRVGRTRDDSIDTRVLTIAGRHLADHGFEAMSMAAIAREADTTRQAIYRRWASKAELAQAVVGNLGDDLPDRPLPLNPSPFVDPYGDLVAELADFAGGVSGPGRLFLVGTMLQDTTDASVQERYRAQVVAPRRRRIRSILEQAQQLELIDADADLEVAVTLGTGSWYARALAGDPVPTDWPARAAALVWRACGGTPVEPTPRTRR